MKIFEKIKAPNGRRRIYFCGIKICSYNSKNAIKQHNNYKTKNYTLIANSKFFNKEWYVAQYPDVTLTGIDPVQHYLTQGWKEGKNPSSDFDGVAYLRINADVNAAKMNPLCHYELYGKQSKRTWTSSPEISFPDGTKSIMWSSKQTSITSKKRLAIFASYSGDGKISDAVIYYLKGLKEVVDNIIFVADNPIFSNELDKIKNLVCYAQFERHQEYDFGSYKRGYVYAKENGLLNDIEEIVICNDSCYGPIISFSNMFNTMRNKPCDFWGFSINQTFQRHVQSFFYVFKKQVFMSQAFDTFLLSVQKEIHPSHVIMNYEVPFTGILHDAGFQFTSFIPERHANLNANLTFYPVSLIQQFQAPLVKVKCFSSTIFIKENVSQKHLLKNIANINIELATLIAEKHKIMSKMNLKDNNIKFFHKTKAPNGRRHIYFCGIKIFSYRRKVTAKQSQLYTIVAQSKYFDKDWYLAQYPSVKNAGVDPVQHYITYGWKEGRDPSANFDGDAYLYINRDVKSAGLNPLYHYERFGKNQLRTCDLSSYNNTVNFNEELVETTKDFSYNTTLKHKRLAVFSSFNRDGKITDAVLYYLKGLREVVDNIIFIADNPVAKEELTKLEGLVCYAECKRHNEYDFGSYKRGFFYAKEKGLLNDINDLILCNDSCYGPVFPFPPIFAEMKERNLDFWGLSQANIRAKFIQSFFFNFNLKVFNSSEFDTFLKNVTSLPFREWVISEYEFPFTQYLNDAGFSWDTYVPRQKGMPTDYPLHLLEKFHYPLVKNKALMGLSANQEEKSNQLLPYIEQVNKKLYDIIIPYIQNTESQVHAKKLKQEELRSSKEQNILALHSISTERVKKRIQKNKKIRVGFVVNMCSMFPARAVFEEMLQDTDFDTKLIVAPDRRFGRDNEKNIFLETQEQLAKLYGEETLTVIQDLDEKYIDVAEKFDVICMSTPYDISYPIYNERHFVYSNVLTFHIDYGFLRSIYDRTILSTKNYSLFWHVFAQTPQNLEEIEKYSTTHGKNAIVTGYAKMDSLAKYKRTSQKKTIIIAPHHSIEGGFNKILSLSNFVEYYKLYLELPQKYPQIDFILRPHPALFFALVKTKMWTEKQCEKYKEDFLKNTNATISVGGEYFQDFVNSDGIINDCGSYLVEYFYTQKPQLYLLKKPEDIQEKFTELGQECLENCYIGYKAEDITDFIDNVILQEIDSQKHQREQFASEKIMLNYKTASKKCINIIKKELL